MQPVLQCLLDGKVAAMLSTSETVWSTKDAMFFKSRGHSGVSYDPNLGLGEWYYKSEPNKIYILSNKRTSKL